MKYIFDPLLVTFSIFVAIFASYVALNIAPNIPKAHGRARIFWLGCGALAMGVGIWSMHFVGMLAFEMPGMPMAYDIPLMILSVVVAVGASAFAFYLVSRPIISLSSLVGGGIAMAAAIAGMHYIGMYSMRMPATIQWNIPLVILSILIALVASFGALFILMRLKVNFERLWVLLSASTLMGFAISGMHYTGMLAATFIHTSETGIDSSNLLVTSGLTITVVATTLFILGVALAGSIGQRLWDQRNKLNEEILGATEAKFRHLVEAVKDYAIFMLDPKGLITTWNSGAQRITGYTEKEVIGKNVSVFYTEQDVENDLCAHELRIARTKGHFESEGQRIRKDGSVYWASVVISPLFSSDGRLTGFSKVQRDITQFKESERRMRMINEELEERVKARTRALGHRERQLRMITDAAPILIAQVDKNERFLFANESFCKWFLRTTDEIIGKTFREILGEQRYPANEPFIRKALSGELTNYERESKSGIQTAMMNITFVPEFDVESQVTGFIVVANDITKHKEIEAELKKAKEAAEVANATKSAFLANMSHEIRTPLGAVLGFSELLLNHDMTPSERLNSVEVIKRNGRLLSNIINDILDLSKVEAGKLEIEKTNVPFHEVMNEVGSILNLEATEKGIELKVTSEGVIPTRIYTDPLRLRQILLNIIGNAIKFTNRGHVDVRVKTIHSAQGAVLISFVIQDTGEGIKPEQVSRLFTPFTQADVSTTRKFGGTGLGLVLSKKLANALGGDVVLCKTEPGKGSTFMVTIDPEISDQVLFKSTETTLAKVTPLENKCDLSQLKILVVDDSADNQALIKKILKLAGAQVETANNGREAIEKISKENFSLILMDLQMPEMDGYEATQRLRQQGYTRPIIALTAHAMKEERQRSLRSGFDEHITKPVDRDLLVRTLSHYSA